MGDGLDKDSFTVYVTNLHPTAIKHDQTVASLRLTSALNKEPRTKNKVLTREEIANTNIDKLVAEVITLFSQHLDLTLFLAYMCDFPLIFNYFLFLKRNAIDAKILKELSHTTERAASSVASSSVAVTTVPTNIASNANNLPCTSSAANIGSFL